MEFNWIYFIIVFPIVFLVVFGIMMMRGKKK